MGLSIEASLGEIEHVTQQDWAWLAQVLLNRRVKQPIFCMCLGEFKRSRMGNAALRGYLNVAAVIDDDFTFPITSLERFGQTQGSGFSSAQVGSIVALFNPSNGEEVAAARNAAGAAKKLGIAMYYVDVVD